MNNSKGFTLIEVMTSLLLVTILASVLLPMLVTVYNERTSIRQEREALLHLDKAITSWIYEIEINDETKLEYDHTTYTISLITGNRELKACISWVAVNKRNYERCASGKR